jgi:hypothetical protein
MIVKYSEKYHDDIIELCREFVKDTLSEYSFKMQEEVIDNTIKTCINNVYCYIKDDKCVGVLAGVLCNAFTDKDAAFHEVIWYMKKGYRRYGVKLYRHVETVLKMCGIKRIVMALMCNSKQDKLDKFYKRLGYKPFEVQYYKEI